MAVTDVAKRVNDHVQRVVHAAWQVLNEEVDVAVALVEIEGVQCGLEGAMEIQRPVDVDRTGSDRMRQVHGVPGIRVHGTQVVDVHAGIHTDAIADLQPGGHLVQIQYPADIVEEVEIGGGRHGQTRW